ncbi:PIR protein [Plasmodium reichenowi]|uniref:PIR protein n=1 Tax=Plasmodium reichenowi TaxID=5854 RepID=A0A2P9DS03_PLARE|nr:PIR protein [Plasmodium reichenowi]
MKVHYINILLFAPPLNILLLSSEAHNKNKPSMTPRHPPTTRLLCECELYAPADYDNDQEMKEVMENFNKQTQQRFEEYDERMKTTRQKCKEQCDKEIQKIILKDKLEKQMEQQLTTLETKIDTDDIPTCVCEKSVADKVEKTCLRCGSVLGGGVLPGFGAIGGSALYALSVLKPAAITAAEKAAKAAAIAAGKAAGDAYHKSLVIEALEMIGLKTVCPNTFDSILKVRNYTEFTKFSGEFFAEYKQICEGSYISGANCSTFNEIFVVVNPDTSKLIDDPINAISSTINSFVRINQGAADAKSANVAAAKTTKFTTENIAAVESTYTSCQTAIIASVIAIVVIVLVMVIIYKILRYRRKKKMKKKMQYIKLLEE